MSNLFFPTSMIPQLPIYRIVFLLFCFTATRTTTKAKERRRRQLWPKLGYNDPKNVVQKQQRQRINQKPNINKYKNRGANIGRAFEPWNFQKKPFPCVPPSNPDTQGFMYIKVPKTSSTTNSYTMKRIARRHASEFGIVDGICKTQGLMHTTAKEMRCDRRNRSKSFLWTLLRDPTKRRVSFFNMRVNTRGDIDLNDDSFVQYMENNERIFNSQLNYINVEGPMMDDPEFDWVVDKVRKTLADYDFIGIFERRDESMVALQLILGLHMYDILFVWKENFCNDQEKEFMTDKMREYLSSDRFLEKPSIRVDTMLYEAANRSLDLTIQRLGRERFEEALRNYRTMLIRGHEQFGSERGGCGIPALDSLRDDELDAIAGALVTN